MLYNLIITTVLFFITAYQCYRSCFCVCVKGKKEDKDVVETSLGEGDPEAKRPKERE